MSKYWLVHDQYNIFQYLESCLAEYILYLEIEATSVQIDMNPQNLNSILLFNSFHFK